MASALVVGVSGVRDRAAKAATKARLAKVQLLLETYKDKFGSYPSPNKRLYSHTGLDNSLTAEQKLLGLLQKVKAEFKDDELENGFVYNSGGSKYDEEADGTIASSDDDALIAPVLLDAYDNSIGYIAFAKGYRVYSLGPDGITASNDDKDNDDNGKKDAEDDPEEGLKLDGKIGDDITP